MRIAVLGAGVAGMTTAYYLAEDGHKVIVIDRDDEPAAATSHANGAQLSYSYTDSLAQPGFAGRIPGLVLGHDSAIRVGLRGNPAIVPWGLSFLRECTRARARSNTLAVLDIALRSAALLADLRARLPIDFAWRRPGKIAVLGDDSDVEAARERARWKRERGCNVRIIDYDEALDLEPALEYMQQRFAAAVYSPDDEVGDARAFCQGLADWLARERNIDLRLGVNIEALLTRQNTLRAIDTSIGEVEVDAAVVCLGPWSDELLRPLGHSLGICPIRGYSVTLPLGEAPPAVSITNIEKRIVYSLLGDRLRIAGFADFVGYDTRRDAERLAALVSVAESIAPQAADYDAAERYDWGGFRPVTPDSRPVVGPTATSGLYVNSGHGVLGWTLACATARQVADAISSPD